MAHADFPTREFFAVPWPRQARDHPGLRRILDGNAQRKLSAGVGELTRVGSLSANCCRIVMSTALEIDEDRAVVLALALRPVIDAENAWRCGLRPRHVDPLGEKRLTPDGRAPRVHRAT